MSFDTDAGWPEVPLGDLCTKIGSGATPRGGSGVYVDAGAALIRSQNVHDDRFEWHGLAFINDEAAERLRGVSVEAGDVLINITGDSVARVTRAPTDVLPARVNQHVAILRASLDGELDAAYLRYFLIAPRTKQHLLTLASAGATRKALTKGMLEALGIPLPPLAEQLRITGILGALDRKIANNREIMALLEELVTTVIEHATKDPDAGDWPERRLGDVLTAIETGGRPRGGVKGITDGVPSIGAESIVRAGSFDFTKTKFVPLEYFEALRRGRLQDRDVLLYKDGGKPGDFKPHVSMAGEGFPFEEAAINEHVYRLRVDEPYTQDFLYAWLRTGRMTAEMSRRGTGVAIPGLNSQAVRELPIVLPDPETLNRLQETIGPMVSLVLRAAKETRILSELREILLPALIAGRLSSQLDAALADLATA